MTYRIDLKIEILKQFTNQKQAASAMGFGEVRLSAIITGRIKPNENEILKIEKVLKRKRTELNL